MKQLLVKQGKVMLEEVPSPQLLPKTILVQVQNSCVSIGTELSSLNSSGTPLWMQAWKYPEKVRKVLGNFKENGLESTLTKIKGKIQEASPIGYSAAGIVVDIGAEITKVSIGDRVACAGSQCAHHAEIIRVPENLFVKIPGKVETAAAATVALGSIALQGIRRAHPTLGEIFVVMGLGLLGQLTVQILKVNGCRVIGVDLDPDKLEIAKEIGVDVALLADTSHGIHDDEIFRRTAGNGADGVIVTASSLSHAVISQACTFCRKKGRVVLVGDVGLHLNREDLYQKELDFLISTSYGPGRYEQHYEEEGLDYPLGYVRWTENRNMTEYLRLLEEDLVKLPSTSWVKHPFDQAPMMYQALQEGTKRPVVVTLSYPSLATGKLDVPKVLNVSSHSTPLDRVKVAVVGAGEFAKGVHLPNLSSLSHLFSIYAFVGGTGYKVASLAKQYHAKYATTDFRAVIEDPEVDAVCISTRHDLHAPMGLEALRAGKHVFLEKPMALAPDELEEFKRWYLENKDSSTVPLLLAGFNRRFSPFATRLREIIQDRTGPMVMQYRMNAGPLPLDHWVYSHEGGGRNCGEACHVYDLFTFLTNSRVVQVKAQVLGPTSNSYCSQDNFCVSILFEEGSLGILTYTSMGSSVYPKEKLEVFVDGKVLVLDDYLSLNIDGKSKSELETRSRTKGHREELEAFGNSIKNGGQWPIPFWQQAQATDIAFSVEAEINPGFKFPPMTPDEKRNTHR